MRGKRAITPVIAVILLIVMTVGIAAFTFIWMQNFVQTLQTQTQQQAQQLQRPQFSITYAAYKEENDTGNLTFVLSNIGSIPINTNDLKITIEEYKKVDGSFNRTVVANEEVNCTPTTINPNSDAVCWKDSQNDKKLDLDLDNCYYLIIATYKGVTAQYTLER